MSTSRFCYSKEALLLSSAGVIGGILPDVDLHYSYPSRILFSLLGIIVAFLWVFSVKSQFSIIELWGAGLGIYLFVRFPIWVLFQKVTVHRGSIHSIIAALLFSFFTAALSFHIFLKSAFISWLIAFFIFLGFLLHLLLDEIYSVDFMGRRLKLSFGSAFKLFDKNEAISTGVIIVGIIIVWFFTPDISQFIDTLTSTETYQVIFKRLL